LSINTQGHRILYILSLYCIIYTSYQCQDIMISVTVEFMNYWQRTVLVYNISTCTYCTRHMHLCFLFFEQLTTLGDVQINVILVAKIHFWQIVEDQNCTVKLQMRNIYIGTIYMFLVVYLKLKLETRLLGFKISKNVLTCRSA